MHCMHESLSCDLIVSSCDPIVSSCDPIVRLSSSQLRYHLFVSLSSSCPELTLSHLLSLPLPPPSLILPPTYSPPSLLLYSPPFIDEDGITNTQSVQNPDTSIDRVPVAASNGTPH